MSSDRKLNSNNSCVHWCMSTTMVHIHNRSVLVLRLTKSKIKTAGYQLLLLLLSCFFSDRMSFVIGLYITFLADSASYSAAISVVTVPGSCNLVGGGGFLDPPLR